MRTASRYREALGLRRQRKRARRRATVRTAWVAAIGGLALAGVVVASKTPLQPVALQAASAQAIAHALTAADGQSPPAGDIIALRGGSRRPGLVLFPLSDDRLGTSLYQAGVRWRRSGPRLSALRRLTPPSPAVMEDVRAVDGRIAFLESVGGQVQSLVVVTAQGNRLQVFALRPAGTTADTQIIGASLSISWHPAGTAGERTAVLAYSAGLFHTSDPASLEPVVAVPAKYSLFIRVVEDTRKLLGPRPVAWTEDVWYTAVDTVRRLGHFVARLGYADPLTTRGPSLVAGGPLSNSAASLAVTQHPVQSASVVGSTARPTGGAVSSANSGPSLPASIHLPSGWPTAQGAGVWVPIDPAGVSTVVMARTFVLPDPSRPDDYVDLVWMNTSALRFHLVAGTQHPQAASGIRGTGLVPTQDQPLLVAAFDGNFKRLQGQYDGFGFVTGGETFIPPTSGLATFAVYPHGRVALGTWGSQIPSSPAPAALLQNLTLIVDHGKVNAATDTTSTTAWGLTVKNAVHVWRSGLGITAGGSLIYAAGPTLTASELAVALEAAGARRAMELDINSYWVTFNLYQFTPSGAVSGEKLDSSMVRSATRYVSSPDSRDFVYVTDTPASSATGG